MKPITRLITGLHDRKSGFILGSGCVVPRDCPIENIVALVEAAKKYKLNMEIINAK
ncbi:MAG: uroporphyrinogen decarboxylase family protein [Phycisphaerales bacterium]